jgi:hypothetical protein
MNIKLFQLLLVWVFLGHAPSSLGQALMTEPNWDREQALQTARSGDTRETLKWLYRLAREDDQEALQAALKSLANDPAFSAPQRDYLLFEFTLGLGELDPGAVNSMVFDYLSGYEAQTLVQHDDFPGQSVPLFNVRGAAAGVQHQWQRQASGDRAIQLLHIGVDAWISAYLESGPVEQRGFIDTLEFTPQETLHELGRSALARASEHEELDQVAARCGLLTGDNDLVQQSISRKSTPGLRKTLAAAAVEFDPEQCNELLKHAIQTGPASNAALAIALLAPGHLDNREMQELMFDTLTDQHLGAAAALVLGASTDSYVQKRLKKLASGQDSLTQKRAALAITTGRVSTGELQ